MGDDSIDMGDDSIDMGYLVTLHRPAQALIFALKVDTPLVSGGAINAMM